MDITKFYGKLLDALASGSIDKITRTAAALLHQHIVILDPSYNVLSSYPNEEIGDIYWDAQQIFGFVPEENLNMIFENDYPSASFRGVTYIDWGNITYPRAVSSIQHNGRVLGHVSVYHTDASMDKEDIVNACICLDKILKINFLNTGGINLTSDAFTSALISKLFLGQQMTPSLMSEWEKAVGHKLFGDFLVVSFLSQDIQIGKSEIIVGRMETIHKYVAAAEVNKYYYLLFYNIPSKKYAEAIYSRLTDHLASYKLNAGVSELFSDISDIQAYMYQSRKALKVGALVMPDVFLSHYVDILPEVMLGYVKENMDVINYTHPLLKQLKTDDGINGTQYYETLITYLNNMCDSAASAQELSVHRNTLLYRINHIQDYYNCSFSDKKLVKALALSAYVCCHAESFPLCEFSQDESPAFSNTHIELS